MTSGDPYVVLFYYFYIFVFPRRIHFWTQAEILRESYYYYYYYYYYYPCGVQVERGYCPSVPAIPGLNRGCLIGISRGPLELTVAITDRESS